MNQTLSYSNVTAELLIKYPFLWVNYSFSLSESSATIAFVKDHLRLLIHLIDTLFRKFATSPFSFEEYTIYHK
jgi:hypothetical protein